MIETRSKGASASTPESKTPQGSPPRRRQKTGAGGKKKLSHRPKRNDGASPKTGAGVKKNVSQTSKRNDAASQTSPRSPTKAPALKTTTLTIKTKSGRRKSSYEKSRTDFSDILAWQKLMVHLPGEEEYDRAVATANLMYRFSRPACVVQPLKASQVQKVIKLASSHDIPITIKNGGHSFSGTSTADAGILMDLRKMNKVSLNMKTKTMTLEGGALWGNAYKQLINGRHDGWVVNGGRCVTVGVSGLILGGGITPFGREIGLCCDSLKEATVVTADGDLVTVKESDDPDSANGMLFWALCGGGQANFGVLVEMKMKVQKLQSKDGTVVAGSYTWYPEPESEDQATLLSTMNQFYTADWPDQMTIDSTWLMQPARNKGVIGIRFLTYFDGSEEDFHQIICRNMINKNLSRQLKRRSLPEKSTRFLHETLLRQWDFETKRAFPSAANARWSIYTSFLFRNDPETMVNVTAIVQEELNAFEREFKGQADTEASVSFIHAGGQGSRRKACATAFRWRECTYYAYIHMQWKDKWLERDMRGFFKRFKARLRPFSLGGKAAYINFPDMSLGPDVHEKAYYGNNHEKLQQVKLIWDANNFFSGVQGVRLPDSREDWLAKALRASGGKSPEERRASMSDSIGHASMTAEESEDEMDQGDLSEDEEGMTDKIAAQQWEQQPVSPTTGFLGCKGLPVDYF